MRAKLVGGSGAVAGVGTLLYASSVREAVTAAIVSVVSAAAAFVVSWLAAHTPSKPNA